MKITHINGMACAVAARLNREFLPHAGQSFQVAPFRAAALLKALLFPVVSVRRMEIAGRHLGWAAVVTEPVSYSRHGFDCRTVILTCETWPKHQRVKAEQDADELRERLLSLQ